MDITLILNINNNNNNSKNNNIDNDIIFNNNNNNNINNDYSDDSSDEEGIISSEVNNEIKKLNKYFYQIQSEFEIKYNQMKCIDLNEIKNKICSKLELYYQKPFELQQPSELNEIFHLEQFYQYAFQRELNEFIIKQQIEKEIDREYLNKQLSTKNIGGSVVDNWDNSDGNGKKRIFINISESNILSKKQKTIGGCGQQQISKYQKRIIEKSNSNGMGDIRKIIYSLKKHFKNANSISSREFNLIELSRQYNLDENVITNVLEIMECVCVVTKKTGTNQYIWNGADSSEFKKLVFDIYHSRQSFIGQNIEFSCQKCDDFYSLNVHLGHTMHPHQHSEFKFPTTSTGNQQLSAIACQFIKLLLSSKLRSQEYLTVKHVCQNFFPEYTEDQTKIQSALKYIYDVANVYVALNIITVKKHSCPYLYQWNGNITIQECKSSCPSNFYQPYSFYQ